MRKGRRAATSKSGSPAENGQTTTVDSLGWIDRHRCRYCACRPVSLYPKSADLENTSVRPARGLGRILGNEPGISGRQDYVSDVKHRHIFRCGADSGNGLANWVLGNVHRLDFDSQVSSFDRLT